VRWSLVRSDKNTQEKHKNARNKKCEKNQQENFTQSGSELILAKSEPKNIRQGKRYLVMIGVVILLLLEPLCKVFRMGAIDDVGTFIFSSISWLIVIFLLIIPIHEGLHAIAGHWFSPSPEKITTKVKLFSINTCLNTIVSKSVWYIFVSFPLLFPIASFFLLAPINLETAVTLSLLLCIPSANDIADIILVSINKKSKSVEDSDRGLFCYSIDAPK
jgi:hypothetical protein